MYNTSFLSVARHSSNKSNVPTIPDPEDPSAYQDPVAQLQQQQQQQKIMMNADTILALERRQAELEARAAELDRREKEQQARMASYQAGPRESISFGDS